MKEKKYLIVGQGLAGTVLACRMEMEGISFAIADDPRFSGSSRIAGGIINPVVFKRLALSDNVKELLAEAATLYPQLEKLTGETFFRFFPIVKFFGEEQERTFWEKRSRGELRDFLSEEMPRENYHPSVPAPVGFSKVKGSSFLDFPLLLSAFREKWKRENLLFEKPVLYNEFQPEKGIAWNGQKFNKIIFCEGYKATENPWFSKVGLAPAKGEIITVSIPGLNVKEILNKGVYIIPQGNDVYRVGATFSWHILNDVPTAEGKEELLTKLKSLVKLPVNVLDHKAGVRPAVVGRKPILGAHPKYNNLVIFNGLGTKGAMLAPYYSKQLLNFLEGRGKIDGEADVKRFFSM